MDLHLLGLLPKLKRKQNYVIRLKQGGEKGSRVISAARRDFWTEVKKVNSTKYRGHTAPVSDGVFWDLRLLGYGQQNLRNFIIDVIQAQETLCKATELYHNRRRP